MTKIKYGHLILTKFPPPKLEEGAIASKYHILAHASGIEKFSGKSKPFRGPFREFNLSFI